MADTPIKILLVDDDADYALLVRSWLTETRRERFHLEWLASFDAALTALRDRAYDICLFDYQLGEHTGLELLREANAAGCHTPVILLTGQGEHMIDLEAMNSGAVDFLIKGEVTARQLDRSLRYAQARQHAAVERERLIERVQQALDDVQTLSGLLPMCAWCKKIRNDTGYWSELESYVRARSNLDFTQAICPTCAERAEPSRKSEPTPP